MGNRIDDHNNTGKACFYFAASTTTTTTPTWSFVCRLVHSFNLHQIPSHLFICQRHLVISFLSMKTTMSEPIELAKSGLEGENLPQEMKIGDDNKPTPEDSNRQPGRPKRTNLSHLSDSFQASCNGSNYLDNLRWLCGLLIFITVDILVLFTESTPMISWSKLRVNNLLNF